MVFSLNDEEQVLVDTVRDFFSEKCSSELIRSRLTGNEKPWEAFQAEFSALGFSEFFLSKDADQRGDPSLLPLLSEEAGRALLPENLLEGIYAAQLIATVDPQFLKEIPGETGIALITSPHCISAPLSIRAKKLTGAVRFVLGAKRSRYLLVPSNVLSEDHSQSGVILVPLQDKRCEVIEEKCIDVITRRYQVTLDEAPISEFAPIDPDHVNWVIMLHTAAEISGILLSVVEKTQEYLLTRNQFGVPVASFQAVQHHLSDMYAVSQSLSALIRFSAVTLRSDLRQFRVSALSACRIAVQDGVAILEKAIQLHGGIGFTWEHDLHLALRRVLFYQSIFLHGAVTSEALLQEAQSAYGPSSQDLDGERG